ncbi:putative RecB family nuclease and DNA segregation ATPase FtsK [Methylacidimicrobium sp. AP8]|uniref:FtsK/SpoIIIE domain-containing protein n=1 Tax=Methylacidimicrobium sp. AP8 TaxID=2730359 RepID=UPI0018C1610F|nr:FtsK/SpoIIIE domain-containing protein [Methylacidimicrobium sp. AP8]CAB4243806.1 putative RecB family nuclease and DNA segregation ATPase FtsK [Methylacidimicrobium sp. AP8]
MNPFSAQRIRDPWEDEPAVADLNDRPLEALLSFFEQLERQGRLEHALVVLSPEPGYGKTHLLGRLFRKLQGRATRIYLQPFEAVDRCWERILGQILRELDRSDAPAPDPGRTQLAQLAALAIGHLTADLFDRGLVSEAELPCRWRNGSDELRRLLRADPLSLWEGPDAASWIEWIRRPTTFTCLDQCLWSRRIELGSVCNPHSWLKVLLGYLAHRLDPDRRRLCLDWMRATSLDPEEAAFLGLPRADIPAADSDPEDANELAKERILDFCRLARFARPFLFCFDQTEAFAQDSRWAARFGYVVATLVDRAPNQMLVVTANLEPWEKRILPAIEEAYRDRMRYKDPALHLSGLNESQARLLAESRLRRAGVEPEKAKGFLSGAWLPDFFRSAKTRGVRRFLMQAEEQWERRVNRSRPEPTSLRQCYEEILTRMRQGPPPFAPDTLQWLLREAGRSLPGWEPEEPYLGRKKHLLLRWLGNGWSVGFGREASSNWKRWEAIAREAVEEAKRPRGCRRSIFLRSWDDPPIPGPRWKAAEAIREACGGPLRILVLDPETWIPLAALYELHAKVLEGDLEFPREEALAFARERLRPWAEQLVRETPAQPTDTRESRLTVGELVKLCLQNDSPPPAEPVELGTVFHRIVAAFAGELLRTPHSRRTPEEYGKALQDLAEPEIAARRARGATGEAERLAAALRAFHENLERIAASGPVSSWADLFEGSELPVAGVFAGEGGRAVRIEGRVDALRRHPTEGRQLVDYKLSEPSDAPQDLLQLAIYAELLRRDPTASPVSGVLEYYGPSLTARTVSEGELRAIFSRQIRPVLEERILRQSASGPESPLEPGTGSEDPRIRETARKLEEFFASHGFPLRSAGAVRSHQLLRFRFRFPQGMRIERVLSLAPTLRVHLGLDCEPSILGIPGFIAVDLPNPEPFWLPWEEAYRGMPAGLTLPLLVGEAVEGQILARDLADANYPHVLVAGTSGSGKSMLLISILATLCRALSPEHLELLLIDPKILTFGPWKEIPQLRGRGLLTEPEEALAALEESVEEMGRRYRILAREGFDSLSRRIAAGKTEIPYRVIFFDEFADWLLGDRQTRRRFERSIERLAQKGRAAGIHLILATQRPERRVVTGLIHANLPVHLCLRVSSAIDSRMVLGESGAEKLLGKGDLLGNLGPGGALLRAQAPFRAGPLPAA